MNDAIYSKLALPKKKYCTVRSVRRMNLSCGVRKLHNFEVYSGQCSSAISVSWGLCWSLTSETEQEALHRDDTTFQV